MNTLIIVADASRARIFEAGKNIRKLSELEDFIHSESRMTEEELGADAPVKSANQKGSLQPRSFPKEHEEQIFASQLAKRLQELHNKIQYAGFILIAPPRFLGMLRKELPTGIEKLVSRTHDKDLVSLTPAELGEYLEKTRI